MYSLKFDQQKDLHYLHSLEPEETRYAKYASDQPSLLATGHKFVDVYQSICSARAMLLYSFTENMGDITGNENVEDISDAAFYNKLYARTNMITSAILKYSLTLDICLQVIWAYFVPSSLSMLLNGHYKEIEKYCESSAVHTQLNCVIALKSVGSDLANNIKCLLSDIENQATIVNVRSIYNHIKHRGNIHIEGRGDNHKELNIMINGDTLPKQYRPSYNIEELTNILFEFDDKLAEFIEQLYTLLIPEDYKNKSSSLIDFFNTALTMHSIKKEKQSIILPFLHF